MIDQANSSYMSISMLEHGSFAKRRTHVAQAVEKFNKALKLDARKHETLWCLGNAYTSQVDACPSRFQPIFA